MLFRWLRDRRRKKLITQPFPSEWEAVLLQNVGHYRLLSHEEQDQLKQSVQIFVSEKYWEGCNGLQLTPEMKVTIAGTASLLLLGFQNRFFDRLETVLLYPDTYVVDQTSQGPAGVVTESKAMRLGETWNQGPVILSWKNVLADVQNFGDGQNVVLHEFAHYLDMQDSGFNGTPELETTEQYQNWHIVMTNAYNELVEQTQIGRVTLLDGYGATNPAEFFAVSTECFFERPQDLSIEHPALYSALQSFYKQDPADRFAKMATGYHNDPI